MLKCQIDELHRTLKVLSVVLDLPVVEKNTGSQVDYYVGLLHVGCEKGLTGTMLEVHWENRFKSDRVYVNKEYLSEAGSIDSTDAKIEQMYQLKKIRSRQCTQSKSSA